MLAIAAAALLLRLLLVVPLANELSLSEAIDENDDDRAMLLFPPWSTMLPGYRSSDGVGICLDDDDDAGDGRVVPTPLV